MEERRAVTNVGSGVEVFVARQPIFDRSTRVYGYELLHRSSLENSYRYANGSAASMNVIDYAFSVLGIDVASCGRRPFVNFTRDLLVSDFAFVLPTTVVVEVLEEIDPDEEVMAACWRLKRAGYTVALDDFCLDERRRPLAEIADMVKIDFRMICPEQQLRDLEQLRRRGIELLAEKVETEEEYRQALSLGYSYFQGFFFGQPVVVSGRAISAGQLASLRLLQTIHQPGTDLDRLYEVIKSDVGLSFKLLKFINSVIFGCRQRISSLRQAVVLLGESGTRKWASTIILSDLGQGRPSELVVESILRARFCEGIAEAGSLRPRSQDLFLLGLFSLIDTLIGRPMDELLRELPLAEEIQEALLGVDNQLRAVYDLAITYERAQWDGLGPLARRVGVEEAVLPRIYRAAIEYSSRATSQDS